MKQDIKNIIATYELPPKLEGKILQIALRQFEEEGFTNFQDVYQRIAHLIEKAQQKREEQRSIRFSD